MANMSSGYECCRNRLASFAYDGLQKKLYLFILATNLLILNRFKKKLILANNIRSQLLQVFIGYYAHLTLRLSPKFANHIPAVCSSK